MLNGAGIDGADAAHPVEIGGEQIDHPFSQRLRTRPRCAEGEYRDHLGVRCDGAEDVRANPPKYAAEDDQAGGGRVRDAAAADSGSGRGRRLLAAGLGFGALRHP